MKPVKKCSQYSCAIAHPNIAFIKYWGNKDHNLRIPQNGSISMNLGDLWTKTSIEFDPKYKNDELLINDLKTTNKSLKRASDFLDLFRKRIRNPLYAIIKSENNFPMGAGIASSASAYAALTLAATDALNIELSQKDLTTYARKGSGSASRSIPEGFVEWIAGASDETSYSYSILPSDHWELVDCIAVIKTSHKEIGSSSGHKIADTSPIQNARILDATKRIQFCKTSLIERDFDKLAYISELDSNLLHSVMLTSTPILMYWEPGSISLMKGITQLRKRGIPVFYTLDAGPNVHVITTSDHSQSVKEWIFQQGFASNVLVSKPGKSARLCNIVK